jgi:FAD/FMN-containing dehydrogenase
LLIGDRDGTFIANIYKFIDERERRMIIEGFSGTLVRPGDADYDAARAIWNAMHDRRPALIARPRTPEDVAAAIRYAREEGLPLAVRCGGHSMPGHSVCDDGLVLDLRELAAVHVDPVARRATVGGGTLLGEVDRATQEHGLVVPAGVVSHTGAGGLTLGGGVGRLMRRFGLTIDSLLSAELVTADGEIVRASADEHPDLFWALRGGGGNFGVVTEFVFALHELREVVVLATFHPLDRARDVIERGRAAMADPDAPDALLWTSFLRRATDVPWMPRDLVGRHGIMSLVEWSGDRDEGLARLARLREELAPAAGDLAVVPFLTIQTITDDLFAHGLRTYIKAGFARDLPDGLIDVLLGRAAAIGSPISQVELLAMGGAVARVPQDATAFPFRDARWLINIPATWRDAADDAREIAWARETYAAVQPFLSEGNYINFMGDDEDETAAGAYGRTLERLQEVKAAHDPDNVFRLNQNITPAVRA